MTGVEKDIPGVVEGGSASRTEDVESKKELKIKGLDFREASRLLRGLNNLLKLPEIQEDQRRKEKIESSLRLLEKRKRELTEKARQLGYLDGLDERLSLLKEKTSISPDEQLDQERWAETYEEEMKFPKALRGVGEEYFKERLREIVEGKRSELEKREGEKQGTVTSGNKKRKEAQLSRLREALNKLDLEGLPEEQREEAIRAIVEITKQGGSLRGLLEDPELMGSGIERLPSAREIGKDEFVKIFRERIRNLIEEQKDQSFDQNWRLVYPLEMAIQDLMPRRGEKDEDLVGPEGASFRLKELRRELSAELNAFRIMHTFIYLYRRVGSISSVIEVSSLLSRDVLNVLLRSPEVATSLRFLEWLGERHLELVRKEHEGRLSKEEERIKNAIKIFAKRFASERLEKTDFSNLQGVEGFSEWENRLDGLVANFWANRVASGLYSGLYESARHDLQVNEAGDFFTDRLFHIPERAKKMWVESWKRVDFPELYESLDLRLEGFWEKALSGWCKSLGMDIDEFKDYCMNKYGIEIKIAEKDGRKKIVGFDLSRAKFEEIRFTEDGGGVPIATDQTRQVALDLDDADKVRKAIFDPNGFLDKPTVGCLLAIEGQLKHLKGREKADWIKGVLFWLIDFYRDRNFPSLTNWPHYLRRSKAKEIFPDSTPWNYEDIKGILEQFTPSLNKEDWSQYKNKSNITRVFDYVRVIVGTGFRVGASILNEIIKIILGVK